MCEPSCVLWELNLGPLQASQCSLPLSRVSSPEGKACVPAAHSSISSWSIWAAPAYLPISSSEELSSVATATCDEVLSVGGACEFLQGQLLMAAGLGEHVSICVYRRNDVSQGHGRGLSSGPCPVYGLAACQLARFWEASEAFSVFPSTALLCVIMRITCVPSPLASVSSGCVCSPDPGRRAPASPSYGSEVLCNLPPNFPPLACC